MSHGLSFAAGPDGERSTTPTGRGVVADALGAVDPVGARAAQNETAWRSRYLQHYRRLIEAGVDTPQAWLAIADAGLQSVHERMVVVDDAGAEAPVSSLLGATPRRALTTVEIGGQGSPVEELVLPYRGRALRGAELRDRLNRWAASGVLEPSAVDAVGEVIDHPEWLRLEGVTVAVLGAGAEMGPVGALLGWGATVAAVDLPRPAIWERVVQRARASAGTLLVPTSIAGSSDPAASAGADLLTEVPEIADWLAGLDGQTDPGQLSLCRRRYPRPAVGGGRRAGPAADGRPTRRRSGLPRHPDGRVRGAARRGRAVHHGLPEPVSDGEGDRPAAALGHPRSTDAPRLPTGG